MIHYRIATKADAAKIGDLHAKSWQQNYRGSLSDDYLDHEVEAERLQFWTKRLQHLPAHEHIIIAEENDLLIGFSCICANADPVYGALIDNLHVAQSHSGQGIGKILMQKSTEWIQAQDPKTGFYLWVLEKNTKAIKFYERLGGMNRERKLDTMYDGTEVWVFRMVWEEGL